MAIVTSLTSYDGKSFCLDLYGQNPVEGSKVDIWQCAFNSTNASLPIPGQLWLFRGRQIRSYVDPTMCVDAKDTASLTLSKCGQDYVASPKYQHADLVRTQMFTWDPHGWLHAADLLKNGTWPMCLVPLQLANSTHVKNGSAVRTVPCSTDDPKAQAPSREMWRPNLPPGPVQPGSTFTLMNFLTAGGAGPARVCLDALSTNASNGAPVRLMPCQGFPNSSAPTQHWALTLASSGSSTASHVYLIRSASQPGMCLDGLGMTAGTRPVLWECNRFEQQLWGYKAYKGSSTVFLFLGLSHGCLHYEKVGDYWQLMIGDCEFWAMGAVA